MTDPQTICDHCSDTHKVTLVDDNGEWVTRMCTHCPVPCQKCRQGGNGPYCEATPCDCECHGQHWAYYTAESSHHEV